MNARRILALTSLVVLASCGGGGGKSSPAPVLPATASSPASASAVAPFTIVIPNASAAAAARKAQYVSSSTKSIAVFAYVSSAAVPPAATTLVNVGPGLANCTAVTAGTSCTINVPATIGPMTFVMKMYDGTNGTGNLLSSGTVAETIVANQPAIPLTLDGVVASVQLALASPSAPAGGGTVTLIVNARDPAGAIIVGAGNYSVPITITSSDPSVTISPSTVTMPSQTVTITYTASSLANVTFSASAAGLSANGLASVSLAIAQPASSAGLGMIYLLFPYNSVPEILAFPALTNGFAAQSFAIDLPNFTTQYATTMAVDAAGDVALDGGGFSITAPGRVMFYAPGSSTSSRTLGVSQTNLSNSYSVGYDAQGNLYAQQDSNVGVWGPSAANQSPPLRTLNVRSDQIGVSSNGSLFALIYVSATNTWVIQVYAPGASGAAAPSYTIPLTGVSYPSAGFAVAPDGRVAVPNCCDSLNNGSILMYAPGATTATASLSGSNFISYNTHVAFGANDDLYLTGSSNAGSPVVAVFPVSATGNASPSRTIAYNGTAGYPQAIAIGGTPTISSTTTISGDMLALSANKTWNYAVAGANGTNYTVTTYADPQQTNGATGLVAFVSSAVAADALPADGGTMVAAAGFSSASDGAHVQSFGSLSNSSYGVLPGSPLLVPSSLSLGQTFTPYSGVTGTVSAIGPNVPGIGACPAGSSTIGVTVNYVTAFGSGSLLGELVTYVPGCGITDFVSDLGIDFRLSSIGSHPELGTLSFARRTLDATWVDTVRSVWRAAFRGWKP